MEHHECGPSRLWRLENCPGALLACAGLPDDSGPAAAEGTLLHARVASGDVAGLTDEQAQLVTYCRNWLAGSPGDWKHEVTLYLSDGLEVLTFGTLDAVQRRGNRSAVVDWKFGRGEVLAAEANPQMAAYALMEHQASGAEVVETYIVQPRLGPDAWSLYEFSDWPAILAYVKRAIQTARAPGAKRQAGAWCRYCPARGSCPETSRPAFALMELTTKVVAETPERMAELLEMAERAEHLLSFAERRIEAIREAGTMLLATGTAVPGWKLKTGRRERSIEDLASGHAAMQAAGMSQDEFLQCCKLSVYELERAYVRKYKAANPEATEKVAKEAFALLLGTLVSVKPGKASCQRQ